MFSRRPRTGVVHDEPELLLDEGLPDERTQQITTLHERTVDPYDPPYRPRAVEVQRTVHHTSSRTLAARKARQATWYFFGVLETLLGLRVLLWAVGANPANPFFGFVNAITWPAAAPFANIVQTPRIGPSTLELGTIFAMLMYLLLAFGIVKLFELLFSDGAR